MMMDNLYRYTFVFILLCATLSCEEDLDELNTNVVDPTSVDEVFLLNNAIIGTSFSNGQLIYDMAIVQQMVSPNSGVLTGGNYNQDNRNSTQAHWNDYYASVIKHTGDILAQLADQPEKSNLLHMTTLIQAHTFMLLTDTYGDVPYFEAGVGISEQIVFPRYDAQETIYEDLINVVSTSAAALNLSGDTYPGEVLYGGDIAQWKKMGYTLLLRLGMRLTKVDAALAQQTVTEAVAGGLMESNDDNYMIRHDFNYVNSAGNTLNGSEANNYYLVKSFVDYLLGTSDPRLGAIAVTYVGAGSGPDQVPEAASNDSAIQVGMPMGFDNGSIVAQAEADGLVSFYEYSQADRTRIAKINSPMFIITYGQTQLLLAEAANRGWVSGEPSDYYEAGVRAHMEQMALYDESMTIPAGDIDTYLTANPFDAGNALEQINTQYWVASFLNGPEAFANFRRSGFPILAPNPFPAQDISGDFINRHTYPNDEIAVNGDNLSEAVARMGPDNLDTKVWWDQ
jgi:hypothetical protein